MLDFKYFKFKSFWLKLNASPKLKSLLNSLAFFLFLFMICILLIYTNSDPKSKSNSANGTPENWKHEHQDQDHQEEVTEPGPKNGRGCSLTGDGNIRSVLERRLNLNLSLNQNQKLNKSDTDSDQVCVGGDVEFGTNFTIRIDKCGCSKDIYTVNPLAKEDSPSRCTYDTWKYGRGQKIIAYSLYDGNPNDTMRTLTRYLKYLERNILTIPQLYPGWILRIYSDLDLKTHPEFCPLVCDNSYVEWCDVHELPVVGDISPSFGMTWRFVTIGDPLVDVFLSRDIDSPILLRERGAVDEWLETSKAIHVMRDHPQHGKEFLGGMWGARRDKLGESETTDLQNRFIQEGLRSKERGSDQDLLVEIFYVGKYFDEILAHDSHFCSRYFQTECCDFPSMSPPNENINGKVEEKEAHSYSDSYNHEFVGCYYLPEGPAPPVPVKNGEIDYENYHYCTN